MTMSKTTIRYHETPDRVRYETMTAEELRQAFLITGLFAEDTVQLVYWDCERTVFGGAVPKSEPLKLEAPESMRCDYFCERRELGILNIGGAGTVSVDGQAYDIAHHDALYVGRGSKEIVMSSAGAKDPARFYLVSYPAHKEYPATLATKAGANHVHLGDLANSNDRVINQMIHENGVKSCQLVMGFTELATGSVWNTFPPHTHQRRTEVYMYFDLPEGSTVLHLLGRPEATRHVFVQEGEVALSPPWSVHAAAGSMNYRFCWGMGGENQRFDDMDHVKPTELV